MVYPRFVTRIRAPMLRGTCIPVITSLSPTTHSPTNVNFIRTCTPRRCWRRIIRSSAHFSGGKRRSNTLLVASAYLHAYAVHTRRIRRNHLQTSRRYLDPDAAPPLFKSRTWTRLLRKHITSCNTIIMRITETAAEINEILFTVSDSSSEFAIGTRLLNGMPPPHP